MKSTFKITFALLLISLIASCGIIKKAETYKGRAEETQKEKILNGLNNTNLAFNIITGSFGIKYSDAENKHNFLGNLKLIKDTLILIRLKLPFGFDLATVKITRDTITVSSVLSGTDTYTFEEIESVYGIKADYNLLQNLLVGNFFVYPDSFYINKLLLDSLSNNKAYLSYREPDPDNPNLTLYKQQIIANLDYNRVEHYTIWDFSEQTYEYYIDFDKFEQIQNQYFPFNIKFKFIASDTVNVEINYKRISIK